MKLHYSISGSGSEVVLLHGLFGSGDNWAGVARVLSQQFRIICPDLRNHGQSPYAAEMSYELMAADLAELIQDQIGLKAHMVGHSMGGKVAMAFAARYPHRVHSLTVVDIAPRAYGPIHKGILDALTRLNLQPGSTRQDFEDALAGAIPDLVTRRFLLKSLERLPESRWRWRFNLSAIRANYEALSEALLLSSPFSGPTCFLKGEHSDYILSEDEPVIRRSFPAVEFTVIPGAGHWVHYDAPRDFTDALGRYLKKNESGELAS